MAGLSPYLRLLWRPSYMGSYGPSFLAPIRYPIGPSPIIVTTTIALCVRTLCGHCADIPNHQKVVGVLPHIPSQASRLRFSSFSLKVRLWWQDDQPLLGCSSPPLYRQVEPVLYDHLQARHDLYAPDETDWSLLARSTAKISRTLGRKLAIPVLFSAGTAAE